MIRTRYTATKVSGLSGCAFTLSVIPEVVRVNNRRAPYRIPFHLLSIDTLIGHCDEWIDEAAYRRAAGRIVADAERRGPGALRAVARTVRREADRFYQSTITLLPRLRALSDGDLIEAFNQFIQQYIWYYGLGAVSFLYEASVSEWLHASVARRFSRSTDVVDAWLRIRSASFLVESERLLRRIRRARGPRRRQLIDQYRRAFFYIDTGYARAPVLRPSDVERKARSLADRALHRRALKRPGLRSRERAMVEVLRSAEIIRDQRKRTNLIGCYGMFRFLEELVRRSSLPPALARRLHWFEFTEALTGRTTVRKRLARRRFVTFVYDGKRTRYHEGLVVRERSEQRGGDRVSGTPASAGTVQGVARIIRGPRDFARLRAGEVLVTQMTRPDFLPIMQRAAAFVTDEGGLTSHAAIVAREMRKPCVVGTKRATMVLKDGDRVEVDAERGIVRKVYA